MADRNIILHKHNGTGYDNLYPKTTIEQVDGLQTALDSKQDDLPTVVNNKYLHTNSSTGALEWVDADALPSQSGQAGKFLKTNGTTALWDNIVASNTARVALTIVAGTYSYSVNHGLNTRDVSVQVYDATSYETIECDVTRTSTSAVTIEFGDLPLHNCVVLFTAMSATTIPSGEEVSY